ncbi:hypothetical protein L7F22_038512 [Adiantum nelumboides]|nr:hypothetical protein [Adiantum nelumboides]
MVVEERWGSLADMTVSVSAKRAAHAHAHLHAIRERKRAEFSWCTGHGERGTEYCQVRGMVTEKDEDMERIYTSSRDYLRDVHSSDSRMKAPWSVESLSWRRRKDGLGQSMRAEDKEIVNAATSALNRFQNDGSFFAKFQ